MSNITYLLGAGASRECLPLVNQIQDELRKPISAFKKFEEESGRSKLLSQGFEKLARDCGTHFSIDTFAKKLFFQNQESELKELKRITNSYFIWKQVCSYWYDESGNQTPNPAQTDKRYDAFIASVSQKTENGIQLPKSLKILSWNYDNQFELSLANFLPQKGKDIYSKWGVAFSDGCEISTDDFAAIKLNGSAGFYKLKDDRLFTIFDLLSGGGSPGNLIVNVHSILEESAKNDFSGYINFAWEKRSSLKNNFDYALKIAELTEVLVVVGYSFPTFNRIYDREILSKMRSLNKIILQVPDTNSDDVSARLQLIMPDFLKFKEIPVITENQCDQFHIPSELL